MNHNNGDEMKVDGNVLFMNVLFRRRGTDEANKYSTLLLYVKVPTRNRH